MYYPPGYEILTMETSLQPNKTMSYFDFYVERATDKANSSKSKVYDKKVTEFVLRNIHHLLYDEYHLQTPAPFAI